MAILIGALFLCAFGGLTLGILANIRLDRSEATIARLLAILSKFGNEAGPQ